MKVVTSEFPNFIVKGEGIKFKTSTGETFEFVQNDQLRIANKGGTPVIEATVKGRLTHFTIAKPVLEGILDRVYSSNELRVDTIDLMEAMADDRIPMDELLEAYNAAGDQSTRLSKMLSVTRRVVEYTFKDKVKTIAESKALESYDIDTIDIMSVDNATAEFEEGGIGDPCDVDGRPGTYQEVDGVLVCVLDPDLDDMDLMEGKDKDKKDMDDMDEQDDDEMDDDEDDDEMDDDEKEEKKRKKKK